MIYKFTTTVSKHLQLEFLKRISGSSLLIQALSWYFQSKNERRKDLRLLGAEEYVPLGKKKKKLKKSLFTDFTLNQMLKGEKEISNWKTGNFLHPEQVPNCE